MCLDLMAAHFAGSTHPFQVDDDGAQDDLEDDMDSGEHFEASGYEQVSLNEVFEISKCVNRVECRNMLLAGSGISYGIMPL